MNGIYSINFEALVHPIYNFYYYKTVLADLCITCQYSLSVWPPCYWRWVVIKMFVPRQQREATSGQQGVICRGGSGSLPNIVIITRYSLVFRASNEHSLLC